MVTDRLSSGTWTREAWTLAVNTILLELGHKMASHQPTASKW